ncbi:MAG: NADH-quinone oxidoreductase subunit L [Verrucomicrobiales bacterium]|nr:NADH-quinone oxidoreductase subunit L [Verrucomicrobiales bacterium]|tara:strand:+ start:4766 stop:6547 length:1782 start_codon:yes stop_codon:yes gene_type:complete
MAAKKKANKKTAAEKKAAEKAVAVTEAPAEPPPVEMVKIKVDGKEVEVPKMTKDWEGNPRPTTMLEACEIAGHDVPHYCYHKKLPVAGNCRMCLVEFGMPAMDRATRQPILNEDGTPRIDKMRLPYDPSLPRGAIACATPIAPGMEIYPSSDWTKQMREGILESLLINHPLDCPICDQAGECKLQEYSVEHGQAESQFAEVKVHKPKNVDLGPRINFDAERCVLCTRCIRFTKEIADDDALGIVNRGSYNTISTFPGKKFDNNYTLNTVDICPVGALTSKDFRFQMRVWFLKETKSICTDCGTGCNILVGSREEKIYRFEPRENDAVNSSWMCDSGRLNYKWVGREDRLAQVSGTRFTDRNQLGSWKVAIHEISEILRDAEQGSVAIVGSAKSTNEELYLLSQLAAKTGAITDAVQRLGSGDGFLSCEDKNPNSNGCRLTGFCFTEFGINTSKIEEGIKNGAIKTLIVFREDVTKQGIPVKLLKKLDHLIVSDLLPTKTTEHATYLLPGAAVMEKRGTMVNFKGRLQKFMKAVEAPGDARPEWEFLHELVFNVTGNNGYSTIEGLFNQMATDSKAFKELKWAEIGDTGVEVDI